MTRSQTTRALALALTLAWLPSAHAGADDALPTGEAVLEQYVEATGGKAAYEKVKNRVSTGELEVTGAAVKGKLTITQAAPNKALAVIDLGGLGKNTEATDGTVAWSLSEINGDRVLSGEEKEAFILQSTFNSEIRWKDRYTKAECTGVEDVDGKPAYKVVLTPKTGKPTTEFYDKASHLQVKQISVTKNPMGEITVETYPSDYRKVDGILMPFVAKQKVLTQEIVMTMKEVKHNVDLPADAFAVPDAVKELLKKKAD